MYKQIKQLADDALALQNKDSMDAALRKVSAMCDQAATEQPEQPAAKEMPFPFERNTEPNDADISEGGAQ